MKTIVAILSLVAVVSAAPALPVNAAPAQQVPGAAVYNVAPAATVAYHAARPLTYAAPGAFNSGVHYAAPYALPRPVAYSAPFSNQLGYSPQYSSPLQYSFPLQYSSPVQNAAPFQYAVNPYSRPFVTQYSAPAVQPGYFAQTPGATHIAPLPAGLGYASHHINNAPAS